MDKTESAGAASSANPTYAQLPKPTKTDPKGTRTQNSSSSSSSGDGTLVYMRIILV
jgi:hypothetical protein